VRRIAARVARIERIVARLPPPDPTADLTDEEVDRAKSFWDRVKAGEPVSAEEEAVALRLSEPILAAIDWWERWDARRRHLLRRPLVPVFSPAKTGMRGPPEWVAPHLARLSARGYENQNPPVPTVA
jgi:hypothetical protein